MRIYGGGYKRTLRKFCVEYRAEFIFGIVLLLCVGMSTWLGTYIPANLYQHSISNILSGCIATICLAGAWLILRHAENMAVRKTWAFVLVLYAIAAILLLAHVTSFGEAHQGGLVCMRGWEMVVANFLLWTLLLYPTETLRPGWMNMRRALLHGTPVFIVYVLDLLTGIDLRVLLALYPVVLLGFLINHIRKYRDYCEENYSSMEHIDIQWIIRYIIMYLIDGALFFTICFVPSTAVVFTQQWLLLVMIAYSTEQILFRTDPWDNMQESESPEEAESNAEYRAQLEEWMAREKPYLNPEFRLLDLRQVLPLNRTYLSQLINAEYGCNFYQYVTNYRIEEAKRLMRENPDMKLQDVAEQSGFSSPTVFARVFSRETGVTPSEWNTNLDNT